MERSAAGTPVDGRSLDAIIGNARLNRRIPDRAVRHGNARERSESGRDNRERPIESRNFERRMAYREHPVGQRMSEDEETRLRQEAHEDIVSWEMVSRISARRSI